MRVLGWVVKFVIFVLLVGFAIRNTDLVTVNFFGEYRWQSPLVFVILVFFVAGALFGVLSSLPLAFRHRREARELRRELDIRPATVAAPPDRERAAGQTTAHIS